MKPYESYKETDIFWEAVVPTNWEITKIKHLFIEKIIKGYPDETLLVASQSMGVVPKSVYGQKTVEALKDLHLLKFVSVGDFVISLRSFQGGIEYAYYQGIISPAYTIIASKGVIQEDYFKYLAKSYNFILLLQSCVSGIREGQNINYPMLKELKIAVPSKDEQLKIGKYLHEKSSAIDTLISDKEKLLTLLAEERQAIISEAVTKGLNPNAPMKDSGVEWIGEIPAEWEVLRVKNILKTPLMYGANESAELDDTSFPRYIRITDIDEKGNLKPDTFRSLTPEQAEPYLIEKGDILLARSGASVGKSYHHESDLASCFAGYLIKLQVNQDKVLSKFVYLHTLTGGYKDWIVSSTIQATIQNVSAEKYNSFVVTLPPLEMQEQIVQYLDEKTSKIDQITADTKEQIALLKEYRQSLISEVVTGKVEVE